MTIMIREAMSISDNDAESMDETRYFVYEETVLKDIFKHKEHGLEGGDSSQVSSEVIAERLERADKNMEFEERMGQTRLEVDIPGLKELADLLESCEVIKISEDK